MRVAVALAMVADPAASPAPSHLTEIAHVRAVTPFCSDAIDKTDRSIAILLDNDRRLGEVENALRLGDFDTSEITRNHAVAEVHAEFLAMREAAVSGNGIMAALRDQIKTAPTPAQKAALTAFEEALDGALTRQKRVTDRIGRVEANLTNDQSFNPGVTEQVAADGAPPGKAVDLDDRLSAFAPTPPSLDAIARAAADDLRDQSIPIAHDEDTAADRMDDAFAPCRSGDMPPVRALEVQPQR